MSGAGSSNDTSVRLTGVFIDEGPSPWQIVQRDADGFARIQVAGTYHIAGDHRPTVEIRVVKETDYGSVGGCDWHPIDDDVHRRWRGELTVPTGGPYMIETRLRTPDNEWGLTGDTRRHFYVGDVWAIGGQSNAVGYGYGTTYDPPVLGVSVFSAKGTWELATHPIADSTDTQYAASRDPSRTGVSAWLAFGREIWTVAGVPIGLVPTALGGSPLEAWWQEKGEAGPLFDNMIRMVEAAGGRVAGLLWHQGESDTGQHALASTYFQRFVRFCRRVREQFGTDLPIIFAQISRHTFEPQASGADERWSMVREAQRLAAQTLHQTAIVPTLDLPLSDHIHISAVGNVVMGRRYAKAALSLVYGGDGKPIALDFYDARWIDASRQKVAIRFKNGRGPLTWLRPNGRDFLVVDEMGAIPQQSAFTDTDDSAVATVIVHLQRPAQGDARLHLMYGYDPHCHLRDGEQMPPLAFYNQTIDAF